MQPSIEQISVQLEQVKTSLPLFKEKNISRKGMEDFISDEISYDNLIETLNFVLSQLVHLTRAHKIFFKISTLTERNKILSLLTDLNTYLVNNNLSSVLNHVIELKTLIRNYQIFSSKDYISDFYAELQKLESKKAEVDELLKKSLGLIKASNESKEESDTIFSALDKKNDDIAAKVGEITTSFESLSEKLEDVEAKQVEITELLTSAKSHEEIITSFAKRVETRETQLDLQEVKTEQYLEMIKLFQDERQELLKQAEDLIFSAKQALNYKTAEGISAAIQTQYVKAENIWITGGWLFSALFFIVCTLILGIVIAFGVTLGLAKNDDHWSMLLSRIALLPVTITAAVFAAKQYIKQKNIIEDYAYKMVLAKSIIGFSEQLLKVKDANSSYQEFITKVLSELFQDPLRKRGNDHDEIGIKALGVTEAFSGLTDKIISNEK